MEASGQPPKPAWMPAALDVDALRESLRGLKEMKLGDSPAEAVAALRQNLQILLERSFPSSGTAGATGYRDPAGATVQAPPFEERPELYVGAAFAGGLALAGIVRLLGR